MQKLLKNNYYLRKFKFVKTNNVNNFNRMDEENYETKHVHNIYSEISDHFSQTRYKIWPSVKQFMDEIPDNASVLEVGCGNGKNLGIYLISVSC